MKKYLLCFLMLFGLISYGQEICNDGIDNDGDGKIDLNDSGCNCNQISSAVSLIPNHSFEEHSSCPNFYSQINLANSWIQATDATTDYFNTCGYVGGINLNMTPYPDGNGMVGCWFLNGWQEYLGACLPSPLISGSTYKLKFNVATQPLDDNLNMANDGVIDYGGTDITIYGAQNCSSLPITTLGCPSDASPNWVVLGSAHYDPVGTWGVLTIYFTPTTNINAIILGSPCDLPNGWPSQSSLSIVGHGPYYFFDNLMLNKTVEQNSVTINSTGNFCSGNVLLHSTIMNEPNLSYNYQWYLNGIAILNATGSTFHVETSSSTASYSLMISAVSNCAVSNSLILDNILPEKPLVNGPIVYCQNDIAAPLSAVGSNLLWYTAPNVGVGSPTAPIPSTATVGITTFYVSQTCVLESLREQIVVTVNPRLMPDFPAINPICYGSIPPILTSTAPNGITGNWTPNEISSLQSASYVFQPYPASCTDKQVLNIDVTAAVEFLLEGGCHSGSYLINAVSKNSSFDLNSISFQWFDQNGVECGQNQPEMDVSAVMNLSVPNFPLTYGLQITDVNSCSYYKSVEIDKIYCDIQRGISPNGDNNNEFFDLRGMDVKHLDIFNRYGVKVYSLENYMEEWKGQSDHGQELPDATYYYCIQFNNNSSRTGWIYLNR